VTAKRQGRDPIIFEAPYHISQGSVSVVRTTFKVYGKLQNLTLSQPKTPKPIAIKFEWRDYDYTVDATTKKKFWAHSTQGFLLPI